jgi:hypothetical protein
MKKIAKILLVAMLFTVLFVSLCASAFAATESVTAVPASASVFIDGKLVAFDAYAINGSNYFKLRDLAQAINGTAKQFDVGYDPASNSITISTGKAYVPVGGELSRSSSPAPAPASVSSAKVLFNGSQINLVAYTIAGSNYFKLRDIGSYVNFNVSFDSAANAIRVDTSRNYLFDFSGTWEYRYGMVYDFVLAKDGTATELMSFSGTYKTSGNTITAAISGTQYSDTTVYSITKYNDSTVLTTDSKSFARYYKTSGGSADTLTGTWVSYCHSNGFIMSVTLNEDKTYTAEMKGVCGTVVYNDATALMSAIFFTGSSSTSIEAAIPYKVTLDADGKIAVSATINGRNVIFNKTS